MNKPVIVLGAGGLAKVAMDILLSNEIILYGFLDDDASKKGAEINNIPVLGKIDDENYLDIIGDKCDAFIAVDEIAVRKSLIKLINNKRGVMPINAIHHSAYIAPTAFIGHGNLLDSAIVVGPDAMLGNSNFIRSGTIIDYETKVGSFVQVGIGSRIGSVVTIEDNVFIGTGVTIVPGITIGKGARIGAGAVVIESVKSRATVFGNPAKPVSV